jgi:uncharacterized protein YneF (UPF0154 family)
MGLIFRLLILLVIVGVIAAVVGSVLGVVWLSRKLLEKKKAKHQLPPMTELR